MINHLHMTGQKFKDLLSEIFEEKLGSMENVRHAFLELDGERPEERIEYPGYGKDAQLAGGYDPSHLPGFRSYVRIVFFIGAANRAGYSGTGKYRWAGRGFHMAEEGRYDPKGCYHGDVFLLIANSTLSHGFRDMTDEEKLSELIEFSGYTIEQLDNWGCFPFTDEMVPEVNGCLPEMICPHSGKYLEQILKKVRWNTLGGAKFLSR